MLQQRKKDYLQRLIEEFFKKLEQAVNEGEHISDSDKKALLTECFDFFSVNLGVSKENKAIEMIEKITEMDLLEQYAKLLMTEYDISENKDRENLLKALHIVEYIQNIDKTYSWERTVLREDILHRLDENT